MLETAHAIMRRTGRRIGLSPKQIEALIKVDQEHVFEVTLKRGGQEQRFPAYRIQHNRKRGPHKGGIRFHPEVDLDESRALATLMSLKTAAVGLPLGGGKGGIAVDPKQLSEAELEDISRQYVRYLVEHIGPDKDVPAPDVNTNAQIMDWMVHEYERLTGDTSKASFTGKSLANNGSQGREAATGRGGVIALREVLSDRGLVGTPLTAAVQGIGNVGYWFVKLLPELLPEVQVVAVSDSKHTLRSSGGLDIDEVVKAKKSGSLQNYKHDGGTVADRDAILSEPVDVLVLAALGNAVTAQNHDSVKARFVLELANGPVDEAAQDALDAQGVVVVPDVVANAGGVIVSYLEWLQNRQGESWDEATVNTKLEEYMVKAVGNMVQTAKDSQVPLKEAAYEIAMRRLAAA